MSSKGGATPPERDSSQSLMTRSQALSTAFLGNARDKAMGVAHAATSWFTPPSDWSAPLSHLESLTTVMLNPLAAHPVYQSESLAKALQLMQQQQRQRSSSSSSSSNGNELVLHGTTNSAWPSSTELLKAEIPESHAPLSLFQGFAATYPSLAGAPSSPSNKRSRHKRKKQASHASDGQNRTLTQVIAEREQKMRDSNKLEKQKLSTMNEMNQITMQIEELVNKRKALEQKWQKLEAKEQQLLETIGQLNDVIVAVEEEGRDTVSEAGSSTRATVQQDTISEDESLLYESGTCYKTLTGHDDDVLCVDFNHPRGVLVSSSMDGTVRAWDLYKHKCVGTLEGPSSVVRCLQLHDACLLTGSEDGSIKQWNMSAIPPPPPSTDSSVISSSEPTSPELSAIPEDLPVLSECYTGALEGHQAEVTALYMDQTMAVSGANDKTMRQWDLETQKCIMTLDVMWASHGSSSSSSSSGWQQWTLDGLHSFFNTQDFVGALQFWNFALASGTMDGKLRMWDLRTGQAHRTLPGHTGPITCLQFDEVHLASGSQDKTIRIWDLRTGSVYDTLQFSSPVTSLQFDAGRIVSANCTENIDIYNRTSFQHTTLQGHTAQINSVRFRDNVLASGGNDSVVKLWAL
ncbi:WD40 repeat-like protein [Lichtheimia hyalospora FSU 10163]|nr:WD40 repeat-like protein [Lichtheimia hyalospora FSU 10163]